MTAVEPAVVLDLASTIGAGTSLDVYVNLPKLPDVQEEEQQCIWTKLLHFSARDIQDIYRIAAGRPWRWILFACGVIVGTERGCLSMSVVADEQFPYDALDIRSDAVYFHIPPSERPNLRAVEPNLFTNRLGSGSSTSQRNYVPSILAARDLSACVCSDFPLPLCEAAHLIPHVKGHSYITTLTDGDVADIESIRNMILLQSNLCRILGTTFAIMPKPNFAYPKDNETWEPHALRSYPIQTHTSCRVPDDLSGWPPNLLFYQVYGAAVLHTFGCTDPTAALTHLSALYYGPSGPMTSAQRSLREENMEETGKTQRMKENDDARDLRTARRRAGGAPGDELEEILACVPVWFFALDTGTQQTWLKGVMRKQEAERAAHRERVAQWRLESA